MIIVLLFVLIFCGGNGAGILIGFLIWKLTQKVILSVAMMLVITIIAFAFAMFTVSFILRSVSNNALIQEKISMNLDAANGKQTKGSENE